MPKFLYVYHGDASAMPATPEDQKAAMEAWGKWMGQLGDRLLDPGEPVGKSMAVTADGIVDTVPNAAFGYSIVEANSIAEACDMAKGNPMVTGAGSVEVAEIMPIEM